MKIRSPNEIKKAVERIIRYQQNPTPKKSVKAGKTTAGKKRTPGKTSKGRKASTTKKGMTISHFKEYIGWYDKQQKAGKLSTASKKGSVKKSTPKRSASKKSMTTRRKA